LDLETVRRLAAAALLAARRKAWQPIDDEDFDPQDPGEAGSVQSCSRRTLPTSSALRCSGSRSGRALPRPSMNASAWLAWVNRPGFRGGSNSGEWSHEEVPEVFARGS
jgi:hypothetical protein